MINRKVLFPGGVVDLNLQQDTETVLPPLQADQEEETELYGWINTKTDGY